MSGEAAAWAGQQRTPRPSDKLTLWALADHADRETARCFPSIAALVEFTGLNRKTIIAALATLERAGLIHDTGERRGRTNQVKVFALALERVPKAERFQKGNCPVFSCEGSQKRDTEPVREPQPKKASPSQVRSMRQPRSKAAAQGALVLADSLQPPALPADVTPDLWAEFVEMRQAMAKGSKPRPWTPGAAKRIANDLHLIAAEGGSPADAISASIANGWAGVRWTGDKHGKPRANHAGQPGVGRTVSAARRVLARMGRSA